MRPYLLALVAGAALALPARAADTRYYDDASLRAVQFLDADVGWAVGDEGVIWKTIDGGKTWERQASATRASLRSLHALSHLVVWVVGREELPGGGSAGVVLFTRDGGEKWVRILANAVPGLNHVRFGDASTGYLFGDGSETYPTGVFMTTDAGRTWQPVKGPRCTTWLAGDFLDGDTGALGGAWSRLGTLREGNFGHAQVDQFAGRNICSMQLRQGRSFAVGQGGLVLHSKSQGGGWDFNETKLPQDVLAAWDFHGVANVGDRVWAVGRPGSAVLASEDKGASWKVVKTGQNLPLNGVHFFDDKRGWAVGEYGTILASTDGGQSWKVQRRGGQRAAVLCVHARAQDLPLDTLAQLGAEQGYLTAAVRLAGPDWKTEAPSEASQPLRFAAADRLAGGAAAETLWQFPLPQHLANADKKQVLDHWDRLHGERAAREILRQLVLAIRMWRPDVIVTDHPDFHVTTNGAGALLAEALNEAFVQAADPKAFPEQIEQLGLQTWKVSKVYGLWDKRDGSHLAIDTGAEGARVQATYAEYATPAAGLLVSTPNLPGQRCYRMLATTLKDIAGATQLMEGVPTAAAGVCRRELAPLEEPDEKLAQALKAQRQLQALAKNPGNGMVSGDQLIGQFGVMLDKLPADRGAKTALIIANEFARQGQWVLAREAYLTLIQKYPVSAQSVEAYRWLIRHNSSSEARRRHELGQFLVVGERGGDLVPAGGPGDGKNPVQLRQGEIVQAMALGDPAQVLHWHQGSLALGKNLMAFGPLFAEDPSIQFCLQASRRRLNEHKAALDFYSDFCGKHPDGPWREVAAQELWFVNRVGLPPRQPAVCKFAAAKPFLDGKFDDECWQGVKPLALKNAVNDTAKEYPTEVMLSFDDKYLYVALKCKHPAGQGVPPAKERPRDADLRAFDRVSILLDLDRDYSTFFRLEVDQRGCVCEDCWGDKRWNPKWFVAIRSEEDCWNIEAAIPLHELTGERIVPRSAWAVNVVRTLPGRGVQAWSTPAGVEPRPEGMALLVFQHEAPPGSKMP
jgi:photosystem II stability/assembly factor-like uncharacterized protein